MNKLTAIMKVKTAIMTVKTAIMTVRAAMMRGSENSDNYSERL